MAAHTGAFTTRSLPADQRQVPHPSCWPLNLWQVPSLRDFSNHLKDSLGLVPGYGTFPDKGLADVARLHCSRLLL